MKNYNKADWYWFVEGDETQVWSSKTGGYVALNNADFLAWSADETTPTRINLESDVIFITIEALEAKQTLRRMRESACDTDNGWLVALNNQIMTLRALI